MKNQNRAIAIIVAGFILTVISTVIISVVASSIYYKDMYVSDDDYSKPARIEELIEKNYYIDYNEEDLKEGASRGMVESLGDPYSSYLSKEQVKEFQQALENEYVGIGVQIESTVDYTFVTRVFENTPAMKAGVEVGDIFSTVNGESVVGLNAFEISNKVRGEEGTSVKLTFIRPGFDEEVEFDIVRASYSLASIEHKMLEGNVGYIKIIDFTSDIYKKVDEAYNDLESQGMTSLIIDVRDNGGGYLNQVVAITDMFVDTSKPIYQEKKRDGEAEHVYGKSPKKDIEVAVLINGNSASASELLAAALNEINGSELIGTKTFGKGTAQTALPIGDGSQLKVTFAQWLTPDGNWIHEVGISPTIELDLNEEHKYRRVLVNEVIGYDTVSDQVRNMQRILNVIGYEVREDGYYDKVTESVISDFQSKNNLEVTGSIDSSTASVLNVKLEEYLDDYKNDNQIMRALEELKDE